MHKQSKKQDFELAALMFLLGLLLFFYPVVTQVSSYQADEEAYEDIAMEYMPPEISPGPVLPMPKRTETPTEETPPEHQDESSAVVLDSPETEPEASESPDNTEEPPVSPAPADVQEATEAPEITERPVLETDETAAPTAVITAAPTKKPVTPTAVPTQPASGINLEACLSQNRDFVAWLTIPGTKINYPVVRSDNTEYYLHHLFTGKESKEGTLTEDTVHKIISEEKKPLYNSVTLSHDTLKTYFPKSYTAKQMENVIIRLLDSWLKKRQQAQER